MRIAVTGSRGQVGSDIMKRFRMSDHEMLAMTRDNLDCTDVDKVASVLSLVEPDLIINAAAYTAVDKAEEESELAHRVNASFVEALARYCAIKDIPLIHLSTDYVFDGAKIGPYSETDVPNPQNVYAHSKFVGEQAIVTQLKKHIILRVSWVFGLHGSNFVKTILNLAQSRHELKIVSDQWGRPTAAADVARVILEIVGKITHPGFNEWGVYHYAGKGITTWFEFAQTFIERARESGVELALTHLMPISSDEYPTAASRPKNSVLNTEKIETLIGVSCCSWKGYLDEIIGELRE